MKYYDVWTSKTTFIDKETGEVINRNEAHNRKKWIRYKTHKKTEYNEKTARGHTEYTIELVRNPQGQFNFD